MRSTTRLGLMEKNLYTNEKSMRGCAGGCRCALSTYSRLVYSLFICLMTTYPFLSSLVFFYMNVKNFRSLIAARTPKDEQYFKPIGDKKFVKLLTLSQNLV